MKKTDSIAKLILTIIFILFIQNIIFTQQNFIEGYIINTNHDTLWGSIDYRNWQFSPDKIKFRSKIDSSITSYSPIDIIKFKVKNEIYESAIIETEISQTSTRFLDTDPNVKILIDTTFLQTLYKGDKSLYYFNSINGNINFYIKQNNKFELLIYKRYRKDLPKEEDPEHRMSWEKKEIILENKKYIGQLIVYLDNCPSLQNQINYIEYNQESISKIFSKYYKCVKIEPDFFYATPKLELSFGILAGASISNLSFTSDNIDALHLSEAKNSPSNNFTAGISLNSTIPRYMGRLAIITELLYTSYEINYNHEIYNNPEYYTITNSTIGASYLKLNFLFRYQHQIKGFKLYGNFGPSFGYSISSKNNYNSYVKFYNTETNENGQAIDNFNPKELGILIGAGATYKNFSFESRFERGNGISTDPTITSNSQRVFILIGYRFTKNNN